MFFVIILSLMTKLNQAAAQKIIFKDLLVITLFDPT